MRARTGGHDEAESAESTTSTIAGGGLWNAFATVLGTSLDGERERELGRVAEMFEGSAILARADGQSLHVDEVIHLCRYCVEVLQPLFKLAISGDISRLEVMKEVSAQKLSKWLPAEMIPCHKLVQPEVELSLVTYTPVVAELGQF